MKMRVGDIEFDSESHVTTEVPEHSGVPIEVGRDESKSEVEDRAQRAVAIYGLAAAALTGVAGVAAGLAQSAGVGLVAFVGVLLVFGALLTFLVIEMAVRLRPARSESPTSNLLEARVVRLRAYLSSEPKTVEALIDETGWREEALLPALAELLRTREIDEDLDLDTGAWTYCTATPALLTSEPPRHTLSLEDRIDAVASPEHATLEVEQS